MLNEDLLTDKPQFQPQLEAPYRDDLGTSHEISLTVSLGGCGTGYPDNYH